ncbi:MAG TPA: hypothetical protein VIR30_12590 [Nocardioides sp.]
MGKTLDLNRGDETSIRPLRSRPRYRSTRLGLGLILAAVVVFTVLFTADLEVDEPNVDGFPAASCGSAYDVAFIKGDGFMGGEVPINQDAIDRKCVDKAQLYVGASVLAGGVLLAAGVLLLHVRRRGLVAAGILVSFAVLVFVFVEWSSRIDAPAPGVPTQTDGPHALDRLSVWH